jgi:hypothetical protein
MRLRQFVRGGFFLSHVRMMLGVRRSVGSLIDVCTGRSVGWSWSKRRPVGRQRSVGRAAILDGSAASVGRRAPVGRSVGRWPVGRHAQTETAAGRSVAGWRPPVGRSAREGPHLRGAPRARLLLASAARRLHLRAVARCSLPPLVRNQPTDRRGAVWPTNRRPTDRLLSTSPADRPTRPDRPAGANRRAPTDQPAAARPASAAADRPTGR